LDDARSAPVDVGAALAAMDPDQESAAAVADDHGLPTADPARQTLPLQAAPYNFGPVRAPVGVPLHASHRTSS